MEIKRMSKEDWNLFYCYQGKIKFTNEDKKLIKRLYEEYVSPHQLIDWNCGICVRDAVSILKNYYPNVNN
jgi:hypothetical protein